MNFVLNMDLSTSGENYTVNEESIIAFSAKYLNAARLDPKRLNDWAKLEDSKRREAPAACESLFA